MSSKRALLVGFALILLFIVGLVLISAPIWLKLLAALAGAGVWWRYRWNTGIREKTMEALDRARRDRDDPS